MICKTRNKNLIIFPSILAIDAPLIAIIWYNYFCKAYQVVPNFNFSVIILFSVWLGYMSDRLLDVSSREMSKIKTSRHIFVKKHYRLAWIIWTIIIIKLTIFCYINLNSENIVLCLMLFNATLAYTILNQYILKKNYIKEAVVSLIFSTIVLIFINQNILDKNFIHFYLICFINCIVLSKIEEKKDKKMGFYSITHILNTFSINFLLLSILIYLLISAPSINNPFSIISLIALIMFNFRKKITNEGIRSILELAYFIVPLLFLVI